MRWEHTSAEVCSQAFLLNRYVLFLHQQEIQHNQKTPTSVKSKYPQLLANYFWWSPLLSQSSWKDKDMSLRLKLLPSYRFTDTEKSLGVNFCNSFARSSDLFHSLLSRLEHTPEPWLTKLKRATATPCKGHNSWDVLHTSQRPQLSFPERKLSSPSSCALHIPLFWNTKATTQPLCHPRCHLLFVFTTIIPVR